VVPKVGGFEIERLAGVAFGSEDHVRYSSQQDEIVNGPGPHLLRAFEARGPKQRTVEMQTDAFTEEAAANPLADKKHGDSVDPEKYDFTARDRCFRCTRGHIRDSAAASEEIGDSRLEKDKKETDK